MEENLKMQLQREFELELLRNHKLKLVNFEHDDSDYIGMNIVDELRSTVVQDLFYLVEKISYISAKNLLKSGVIKNFYTVHYNDTAVSHDEDYPLYFCTDILAVRETISEIYTHHIPDAGFINWNENLHIFVYKYDQKNITYTQLY